MAKRREQDQIMKARQCGNACAERRLIRRNVEVGQTKEIAVGPQPSDV